MTDDASDAIPTEPEVDVESPDGPFTDDEIDVPDDEPLDGRVEDE